MYCRPTLKKSYVSGPGHTPLLGSTVGIIGLKKQLKCGQRNQTRAVHLLTRLCCLSTSLEETVFFTPPLNSCIIQLNRIWLHAARRKRHALQIKHWKISSVWFLVRAFMLTFPWGKMWWKVLVLAFSIRGSCTYYKITFWGPERPPHLGIPPKPMEIILLM